MSIITIHFVTPDGPLTCVYDTMKPAGWIVPKGAVRINGIHACGVDFDPADTVQRLTWPHEADDQS